MAKYDGFKSVELRRPKRSTFDLSHEKRVSGIMGNLMPVLITETLPNDTFRGSTEVLIKLAPMIAPIFHRLNMYVHFFFVPMRLLWEDWETFITGGRLGVEVDSPPIPPYVEIQDIQALAVQRLAVGGLSDYLGIPPIADADEWGIRSIDAMPFAAYWKIFCDYYRDRNYIADDPYLPLASGELTGAGVDTLTNIRIRAWEHDYYTSALPWTQRGAEVLMPLEGGTGANFYSRVDGSVITDDRYIGNDDVLGVGAGAAFNPAVAFESGEFRLVNSEVSINDLRRAEALQQWLERNALAGSRYNESIMAHFGRKTSDSRLQRAEYLGGGKAVIQISEVMTTAYSEDDAAVVVPPGTPSGRGSSYSTTNRFSYNCEEHGFVMGILSVMPSSGYMQGLPRMFQQRRTFLDYPWPSFAHLGEQEVYDYEIFMSPTSVDATRADPPVFGYQSRYSDWKFIHNSSHGDFRTTLDFWHLTRKFASQPVLGNDFIEFETTLADRIFNVSAVDHLWMYIYNQLKVKRSLPYFGTPKLV